MNYTTIAKVRTRSGFSNNTNITDDRVRSVIARAESYINSYVSHVYQLPLPYFWQNSITFAGPASGDGTVSVTIDGTVYSISVTSGDTASQVADKFRREVLSGSPDFITDPIGSGAEVLITANNQDESVTDVDITAKVEAVGITITEGTANPVTVPFIEYLATEIATAYLFFAEYGEEAKDTDKDGSKFMGLATEDLKGIQGKSEKLHDFSGTELPRSQADRISFYPNASSEDDADDPTAFKSSMNKVY